MRRGDFGCGLALAMLAAAFAPGAAKAQGYYGARMVGPPHGAAASAAPQIVYSAAPAYAAPQPYDPRVATTVVTQPWPPRQPAYAATPAQPAPTAAYGYRPGRPAPTPAYGYLPGQPAPTAVYAQPARSAEPATGWRRVRVAVADPGAADEMRPQRGGVAPQFRRTEIAYAGRESAGTIIVDTPSRHLYLVQPGGRAIRYGIGVGRPGFEWSGVKRVSRKAEWPSWRPPAEMRKRRPDLPDFMAGGERNPLGARALYLGSSLYRIHGTNEPHTIGHNVSSGCIRMMNEDVIDLYDRVGVGAKVVVM